MVAPSIFPHKKPFVLLGYTPPCLEARLIYTQAYNSIRYGKGCVGGDEHRALLIGVECRPLGLKATLFVTSAQPQLPVSCKLVASWLLGRGIPRRHGMTEGFSGRSSSAKNMARSLQTESFPGSIGPLTCPQNVATQGAPGSPTQSRESRHLFASLVGSRPPGPRSSIRLAPGSRAEPSSPPVTLSMSRDHDSAVPGLGMASRYMSFTLPYLLAPAYVWFSP